MKSLVRNTFRCLWLVWFAACDHPGHGEVEPGDNDAEAAVFEGCPDTIPAFSLGMSTSSSDGSIKAILVAASHTPPARFLNDWTVKFTGADGSTPLTDASLNGASAFMPVHGHYGKPDPKLAQHEAEAAVYDIDNLNLFMRGPWQIKLELSTPSSVAAELVFDVCVDE